MKNTLARILLSIFYLLASSILFIQLGRYLVSFSFIEDFILFIPRWLVFLPLCLALIIHYKLIKSQKVPITIVTTLLLIFHLHFYINLPAFNQNTHEASVRVMSFNMARTTFDSKKLDLQINYNQPDIMVFQEALDHKIKKSLSKEWFLTCQASLCLASKTPSKLVDFQTRKVFNGWGPFAALFELKINGKQAYVLNVHLETPRKGYEDIKYGTFDVSLMKNIYEQRYLEAMLSRALAEKHSPVIIAGDFNMPSDSWIYNKNFNEFTNTFNEKGFGNGYTKHTRLLGVRIDHILVDKHFSVLKSWVDIDTGSDHRPIFADILPLSSTD